MWASIARRESSKVVAGLKFPWYRKKKPERNEGEEEWGEKDGWPSRHMPYDLQVRITQGNHGSTIITCVTTVKPGSSNVLYMTWEDNLNCSAKGNHLQYTFYKYTSRYIHHCAIKKLKVTGLSNIWCLCLYEGWYLDSTLNYDFLVVWYKALLCRWETLGWRVAEKVLVQDPSEKWPRCSI